MNKSIQIQKPNVESQTTNQVSEVEDFPPKPLFSSRISQVRGSPQKNILVSSFIAQNKK